MCPVVQLSTTEGNSYYVGTKMDAFVYDTLNAWYQEDMGTVNLYALLVSLPCAMKGARQLCEFCKFCHAKCSGGLYVHKILDKRHFCMPDLACSAHQSHRAPAAGHPC